MCKGDCALLPLDLLFLLLFVRPYVGLGSISFSAWRRLDASETQLLRSGYTQITQPEADEGCWKGESIKDGEKNGLSRRFQDGVASKPDVSRRGT